MKIYQAQRQSSDPLAVGGCQVLVLSNGANDLPARPLHHVKRHSPTGFEWGYGGSGPADLALSILADHLGERPTRRQLRHGTFKAWGLHQAFKLDIIATADRADFTITSQQIDEWLAGQEQ